MIKWQEMKLADIFDVRDQILTRSDFVQCDDADYLKSITTLNLGEICPDIVLLNHEQAIKENRCIQNSFPNFAAHYWKIGDSGQGDSWLWSGENKHVAWFDHDLGEFDLAGVQSFSLTFEEFVELAFVIRNFESQLDLNEKFFDNPENMKLYETALENIAPGLSVRYPYRYF